MKKIYINRLYKVIFVLLLFLFILFLNNYKCMAVSSKEEIQKVKDSIEEYMIKSDKKDKYTDYRYYILGNKIWYNEEKQEYEYPITYPTCSAVVENTEKDYYEMEDNVVNCFKEYLDKYKEETAKENEKLIDYFIGNYLPYTRQNEYKKGDKIEAYIYAFVCPANENSIWQEGKEKMYIGQYDEKTKERFAIEGYNTDRYYIRVEYNQEKNKYEIAYIDIKPEGYDEFVKKMNEQGVDIENIDYEELINSNGGNINASDEKSVDEEAKLNDKQTSLINEKNVSIAIVITLGVLLIITLTGYFKIIRKRKRKINNK